MYQEPYNFNLTIDDYGNQIVFFSQYSYMGWVYSTCTYGSFGEGYENDFVQDI